MIPGAVSDQILNDVSHLYERADDIHARVEAGLEERGLLEVVAHIHHAVLHAHLGHAHLGAGACRSFLLVQLQQQVDRLGVSPRGGLVQGHLPAGLRLYIRKPSITFGGQYG
jgi:hypothetical protein